mmetsp:Transcript_16178/g.22571  ORF Transcript_16178/g.22571 Transcript_16178/m.22571 type:complete len:143 (-) Transcript_16178:953-1381(-)
MSVNEVKNKIAVKDFEVRGKGRKGARTFAIGNEDHTLGNSLRHVMMNTEKVSFTGYSVPHPSEPIVQIRVQTKDPDGDAIEALQESCQTLHDQCSFVLERLEDMLPEVRDDRIRMEQIAAEEGYGDDEEEGDEEEEVIMEED